MRPPPIRARLLGPTDIRVSDRLLASHDWPRQQGRSILLMLLGTPGHRLTRDAVLDAIWPERDLASSLNALYKALHSLRRTLEPGLNPGRNSAYIDIRNNVVSLRPHEGLWVDVDQFDRLLLRAIADPDPRRLLRQALNLYRGTYLADELYTDWPIARRESLRAVRLRAAIRLAQLDIEAGESSAPVNHLEAVLAEDQASEEAHREIARAYLATGHRTAAMQQLERCRLALDREFGSVPDPETEALVRQVWATLPPVIRSTPPAMQTPFFNVASIPTPTVGREQAIGEVHGFLAEDRTRLLTIVGTGGVGKTRLATEVARRMAEHFPDGVAFVDLSVIRDPLLLYPAIAASLNVQGPPGAPVVDAVHDVLARRPRTLLVLDNLEHLPELDGPIASLLASAHSVTMLATSRAPLRIRAERLYPLSPLAVPNEPPTASSLDILRQVDSVLLFLQCMDAWGAATSVVDGPTLTTVASLCQRLEGIPLAIELAAARCWTMSPSSILEQIDRRFEVLRDGPGDLPARHRSLEATISWSHDLLSDEEQRLFRGLAVFTGGAEIDSLQEVFGAESLTLAESLVEKSLARWERKDGHRQIVMLESVRDFAGQRLAMHAEEDEVRLDHARHFANLTLGARQQMQGMAQVEWARRLERDQDNIHQALAFCLASGHAALALRITAAMGMYWFTHGPTRAARAWIEQALGLDSDVPTKDLAWTALWGAAFSWRMADAPSGERYEQRARAIWRALRSPSGLARVDHAEAIRLGFQGKFNESLGLHQANLATFRSSGDGEGIVFSLVGMAHDQTMTNQPDSAVESLEQALVASQSHDNLALQSHVLARLPSALLAADQVERAEEMATEGQRVSTLIGDRRSLPWASIVRSHLAVDRNDLDAALTHAVSALAGFQDVGDTLNEWMGSLACVIACTAASQLDDARYHALQTIHSIQTLGIQDDAAGALSELANLLLVLGHPVEALTIHAAALSPGRNVKSQSPAARFGNHHARIAAIRSRVVPDQADAAWNRGQSMPLEAAFRLIQQCLAS